MKQICSLLWLLLLPLMASAAGGQPFDAFVSIMPQRYLLQRIGGEFVNVHVMVRPGQSPETYEPTPREMSRLAGASFYFSAANPFERQWLGSIRDLNPDLRIVDCCSLLADRYLDAHPGAAHEGEMPDPHVWTSPIKARQMARCMADALIAFDPARKSSYEENFQRLAQELEGLDREIQLLLKQRRTDYIAVSHPSWGYFCDRYGLRQLSLERHGKEQGARRLVGLLELARAEGIHTIFMQKQFRTPSALAFAQELQAQIVELDPLAEDYFANLRAVSRHISTAINQ